MQRRQPVTALETESGRVGCEQLAENPAVLERHPQGARDHLTDLRWIGPGGKKVRCNSRRTSDLEAVDAGHLGVLQGPHAEPNISAAGLPSPWHEELVAIGSFSADAVDGCGGPM
jgi:hypothetical protein